MQQQNYSLQALAERDRNDPFKQPAQPVAAVPEPEEDEETREAAAIGFLLKELADADYA